MFVLENETMPTKRGRKKAGKETPLVSSVVVSKNDVNGVCSILELLGLHIGKQESSLLAYVGHSERNASIYLLVFNETRLQRHKEATPVGPV